MSERGLWKRGTTALANLRDERLVLLRGTSIRVRLRRRASTYCGLFTLRPFQSRVRKAVPKKCSTAASGANVLRLLQSWAFCAVEAREKV